MGVGFLIPKHIRTIRRFKKMWNHYRLYFKVFFFKVFLQIKNFDALWLDLAPV